VNSCEPAEDESPAGGDEGVDRAAVAEVVEELGEGKRRKKRLRLET
jgi:hypothetical protein